MPKNKNVAVSPRSGAAPPKQTADIRAKISAAKTKFTKEVLVKAGIEYLDFVKNSKKEDKVIPTVAGYALFANINLSHLYEKAQMYPEVAQIIGHIQTLQEHLLIEGGLTGKTNPVMSIFLLKAKHNFQDSPQSLVQNNNFTIAPDVLAEAFKLIKK